MAGIAVACTLMWGSSFPLIKIGYAMLGIRGDIVSIMYFAAFRFIIAAMIMLAGMKLSGRSILVREKADYLYLVIIALLQTTIQFTLFYIGLANTTGTKAAIINGSGSFFVVIFSHMFFAGDKISLRKLAGILLGFAGLVLVNLDSNMIDCSFSFTGEGFILLTSITGAIGTVVIKKVSARISPVQITAFQFLIGAAMLFAISAALEFPPPLAFTPGSLLLLIYLGVISSASFSLWYLLIRHNNLSRVAVYFFLVPIWGALSSTILIDTEFLSLVVSAALLLVSMGIFLTNMAQRPLKKKIRP